jgi:hypothetical protein
VKSSKARQEVQRRDVRQLQDGDDIHLAKRASSFQRERGQLSAHGWLPQEGEGIHRRMVEMQRRQRVRRAVASLEDAVPLVVCERQPLPVVELQPRQLWQLREREGESVEVVHRWWSIEKRYL